MRFLWDWLIPNSHGLDRSFSLHHGLSQWRRADLPRAGTGDSLAICRSFINIFSCSPGQASICWRNFLRYHWTQVFSNSTSQNNSSLYFPLIEERSQYWHLEPCLWLTEDFKHVLFYSSVYGIHESILKAEKWWLPKRSPCSHTDFPSLFSAI